MGKLAWLWGLGAPIVGIAAGLLVGWLLVKLFTRAPKIEVTERAKEKLITSTFHVAMLWPSIFGLAISLVRADVLWLLCGLVANVLYFYWLRSYHVTSPSHRDDPSGRLS